MNTSLLSPHHGVIVPMVTPVTPSGDLDEPAARRIIDHMIAGGVHGIFVLGTSGENTSVPAALRERLVSVTAEHVGGRARVYAGISNNCLADSVAAARTYASLGADAAVAHLPTYYALNAEEQLAYFTTLANRIDLPLVLYNIPSTTHMTIPIEVVQNLSRHPNIVGIKDSERDSERLTTLIARFDDNRSNFAILVGEASLSVHGLTLGADGIVPAQGNLIPASCRALYDRAVAGDRDGAEFYQQQLDAFAQWIIGNRSLAQWLGALKAAMGALGLCGPDVLPPLQTRPLEEQATLRQQFLVWREDWENRARDRF